MKNEIVELMKSFAHLFELSLFYINREHSSCEYSIQKRQYFTLDLKRLKEQLPTIEITKIQLEFFNTYILFTLPVSDTSDFILGVVNTDYWISNKTVSINKDNIQDIIHLFSLSLYKEKMPIHIESDSVLSPFVIEKPIEDSILGQAKLNISEGRLHQNYQKEKELFQAIQEGNIRDLEKLFAHFSKNSDFYSKLSDSEFRHVKNMMICIICLASRAAIEGGVSKETAFSLSDHYICEIERFSNIPNNQQLLSFLDFALKSFAKQVAHNKKQTSSGYVSRCQQIISLNIYSKLSVKDIADELGLSQNYLSTLFKNEMGYTIKDYILQQKIIEAQYLLLHSQHNAQEIWTLLNFSSQSHFIQIFKKYLGLTPKQYKNIYHLLD